MMTDTLLRGSKKFGDLHLVKPNLAFTGHQSDIFLTVFGAINDDVVLLAICREKRCFVTHYNNVFVVFEGKSTKKKGE